MNPPTDSSGLLDQVSAEQAEAFERTARNLTNLYAPDGPPALRQGILAALLRAHLAARSTAPEPQGPLAEVRRQVAALCDQSRANFAFYEMHGSDIALLESQKVAALEEVLELIAARPAAPEAQGTEISQAARDVLAERRRQVEAEGWTPEHDDIHARGQMALAAAGYAYVAGLGGQDRERFVDPAALPPPLWPWDLRWWKPTNRRRDLVKSAALSIAEIERLDRLPAPPASSGQEG